MKSAAANNLEYNSDVQLTLKHCNTCGHPQHQIPASARPWIDGGKLKGHFWECVCGSTMFLKKVDGK